MHIAHGLIYAQGKEAWDFEKMRPISLILSSMDDCLHSSKGRKIESKKTSKQTKKNKRFPNYCLPKNATDCIEVDINISHCESITKQNS